MYNTKLFKRIFLEYEEFEKAVDMFGILTRVSRKDLKKKYLKLSKKYHPDMPTGSEEKFLELKKIMIYYVHIWIHIIFHLIKMSSNINFQLLLTIKIG